METCLLRRRNPSTSSFVPWIPLIPPDMLAALHSMEVAPSSSADSEDPECASDSSDSDDDLVL